jgi:hypothetical protein
MSDSAHLERRYRQLLACYPRAFRYEHEQEILAVLMAGADEDQQRPRLGETANLIKHALWMRLGLSRGRIMINERTFPIRVDRPSRTLMTAFGAGRKAPLVKMSPSTVHVRMGSAGGAGLLDQRGDQRAAAGQQQGDRRGGEDHDRGRAPSSKDRHGWPNPPTTSLTSQPPGPSRMVNRSG